ncbi:TPA: ComEC/Rec2 family competence protein [Enterobacter kobei]
MAYEIDFLNAGNKSSGDAICVRWGNLEGERHEQKIVVIDAGYKDDGLKVVNHIKKYYKTDVIDLLISTHPDGDHVGGLLNVLENIKVEKFWIHKPWDHNTNLASKFHDGRITDNSISERIKDNLEKAYNAVRYAEKNNIEIIEPFQGTTFDNGNLVVLGPTSHYYDTLIPFFSKMPLAISEDASLIEAGLEKFKQKVKKLINCVAEWLSDEGIDNNDTTSAQNNSSVICQLTVDGRSIIFTGDAGVTALNYAEPLMNKDNLVMFQVPHHGSRRNISPELLDKIIGNIMPEGEKRNVTAMISCAGGHKHPHQAVINAFTRRGAKVITTEGTMKRHGYKAPTREGWSTATPREFLKNYQTEE